MLDNGWEFKVGDGATGDQLFGSATLWQIYVKADPHYSGRVTVPVLWDKKTGTIVSNESAEIIRMGTPVANVVSQLATARLHFAGLSGTHPIHRY